VKHAEPCGTVSIGAINLDKMPKRVKALHAEPITKLIPLFAHLATIKKAIVARNIMEIPRPISLRPLAGRSTVSTAWPPESSSNTGNTNISIVISDYTGLYTCQRVRSNKAKPLTRTRHGRKWNSFIETEDEIIQRSLTFFGRWLLCAKSPALPRPGWSGAGRGGTGVCTRSSVSPRIIVINP
jgi:hypothetical protein